MGFISRKVFPACGSMCVCCPALRSRSRQPVKRYKKLLADIFPKTVDGPPNERKIVRLCEYAAKNPFRIPKIAKYLEERCHKELRYEHFQFLSIIAEAYSKMLLVCKDQMAYFVVNLLNVVTELLDNSKQDAVRMLGCQILTKFICSQADGTYAHNIENMVMKVCKMARERGEEHQQRCLRASSLQCLSAMVWFMEKSSYIFLDFDEIIHATLDNYELDVHNDNDEGRGESHHHWVDEVVRCEGKGMVGSDASPSRIIIRPRPEKRDPSGLTREESEAPKVWAQICIQRMAELAKESTTMRRLLDPMFVYFDSGGHWVPHQGLALIILSDMSYFLEFSGNQQLVLASVIRHLDHKNIAHDPQLKSHVIQVATALARQIRSGTMLTEIGSVSDLCRHLRKSLQAIIESAGEQDSNLNVFLQTCIEDCLVEIAKGIGDARPLFDLMTISLEKLPSAGIFAKSTVGSLVILAHVMSLASVLYHSQQVFPEALFVHLLKVMLHPDVEARIGAHQLFSILLIPNSYHPRHDVASLRSSFLHEPRQWRSDASSTFASITALLEKLRKERDGSKVEKHLNSFSDDFKERDKAEEEFKWTFTHKNSPNVYKLSSIIDKTAGSNSSSETEPFTMMLSEDQIAQLLSAFWIQANLPDNQPSNIEAVSHSFILTLVSLRLRNPKDNLVVRIFQLALSLRKVALDPSSGLLPPACQRLIFTLSMGMLMFAAKIYQVPIMNYLLKNLVPHQVDPYLGINDDLQVYVKRQADMRKFGSSSDNQEAKALLLEMQNKICETDKVILDILVQNLCNITELKADEVASQMLESFTPDEAFMFGPQSVLRLEHNHMASRSKESLSSEVDFPTNSIIEDEATSEASVVDLSRFIPKVPPSPSMSHVVSIGQLLESALEVAGQVAASSVSTSPLPYNAMASQCEALGMGARQKLSSWLAYENHCPRAAEKLFPVFSPDGCTAIKITNEDDAVQGAVKSQDPWLAMRLPPASPFDNFLRAAGC